MKNQLNKYRRLKNLFLRQSYLDAWEDYQRSLLKVSFPKWDYIILTASNEEQGKSFEKQIEYRREKKVLPETTKFLVIPDPQGKRVGSGGATLHVLRTLSEQEGFCGDFYGKRILVIHSGGDSKRVPQYSICGKLFSPVPRELPDGRGSTLFDEFLIGMAGVPSRFKEGMLVLSGDVLLLFNPLQIDSQFSGAAAISMKSPLEIGKDHGVFLNDGTDHVQKFLHKQSTKTLIDLGAVNEQGNVDLDTGAVLCDAKLVSALFSLISDHGIVNEEKYRLFVNEKSRISFYGDFLYPLALDSTLEQYYKEQPEGVFCEELRQCRKKIWETLCEFRMKLICLSPAEFIHFGTTRELLKLLTEEIQDYEFLDWSANVFTNIEMKGCAIHDGLVEADVELEEGTYIEGSWLSGNTVIRSGAIVSQMIVKDVTVPKDTVWHGVFLREQNAYIVRTYGVLDNPKKTLEENGSFLDGTLQSFLQDNQLSTEDLWETTDHSLWNAKLYSAHLTQQEAAEEALLLWKMSCKKADEKAVHKWQKRKRYSLCESFAKGDTTQFVEWKEELENRVLVERFLKALKKREDYISALKIFGEGEISEKQYEILMERIEEMEFSEKIRVLYAVARSMKYRSVTFSGVSYDLIEQRCFGEIQKMLCQNHVSGYHKKYQITKEAVKVKLPVRVNWGGGWTDTPPYCNENGGVVLNASIVLKGEKPIEVEIKKIPEYRIEFASLDFHAYGKAETVEEIQDCHNPYDSFALHKAALIACGVIPLHEKADLSQILKELGSGFYLSTKVCNVPKGSGLGTSSILSSGCVRAIGEFLGQHWSESQIYELVLDMEQIMSTGGGWQDQVGGLTPGVKYITSRPGADQKLKVEYLDLDEATRQELQERFVLVYTGQRRLARNLLREVVGNYIGGRQESIEALKEMKHLAVLMRFELEQGNVDAFAELLNRHWEVSKMLDAGSTNTCIDQIFASCEDMIDGRFISGAGGGGFLQMILKKGVTREELRKRLKQVFEDSGVDVWETEFIWN